MRRSSKHGPLSRGDVRDDGMVFFSYLSGGKEYWLTPDKFLEKMEVRQQYEQSCKAYYNTKNRPTIGTYCATTGLYYIGRSGSKERWVADDEYRQYRSRRNRILTRYRERVKEKAENNIKYKRMQKHPEKDLYFVYLTSGKPVFKPYDLALQCIKEMNQRQSLSVRKNRIRKRNILEKIKVKHKRGDQHLGLYFWDYNSYGRPIWITEEEYSRRKDLDFQRRERYLTKKKMRNSGISYNQS